MMFALITIIVLSAREISGAVCPSGFESHEGSCYFFSHGQESWTGAYESCKLFGSMLVEVNSANEDAYLQNKTSSLGSDDWWISLTDKQVEGEFLWETSKHVLTAGDYKNWASGEPDNHHNQNCARYKHSKNFQWADSECDDSNNYICEVGASGVEIVG